MTTKKLKAVSSVLPYKITSINELMVSLRGRDELVFLLAESRTE